MAACWPPTPPTPITAAEIDSASSIGRARKGIDFSPRMGYEGAYLKLAPNQSQSPRIGSLSASVTQWISQVSDTPWAQTEMSFWDLNVFGVISLVVRLLDALAAGVSALVGRFGERDPIECLVRSTMY